MTTKPETTRFDVGFYASGEPVPTDYGYPLFSALCRALGNLHGARWLQVLPLACLPSGLGRLRVRNVPTALCLRVTPERLGDVVPLAGRTLDVAGSRLTLGGARVFPVRPFSTLASRHVTFKGYLDQEPFTNYLEYLLSNLGVRANVVVGPRRTIQVLDHREVGYGVRLDGLSDEDSLLVQGDGLGGRRRFGCGVFGPASR
jgi:CRISPR-associated protein Cas6